VINHEKSASAQTVADHSGDPAIAEFIRTRGITRCPTACVVPTQGSVAPDDRAALAEYAESRDRVRRSRAAARQSPFLPFSLPSASAG